MFLAHKLSMVGSVFNPLSLSPALWLSDTGADPAQWDDLSSNARHATQGNSGLQPSIISNSINGKQIRRFDGSDDALLLGDKLSFLKNSDPFHVFIVLKSTQTASASILASQTGATNQGLFVGLNNENPNRFIFRLQSATGRRQIIGTSLSASSGNPTLLECAYAGGAADVSGMSMRVNGVTESGSTTSTNSGEFQKTADAVIGNRSTAALPYNGDIGSILIFPFSLSAANRLLVERFLGNKSGITTP